MKKYIVNVTYETTQQVEVEAENEKEACNKAFIKVGPPSNSEVTNYDVERDYYPITR